MSNEPILMTDLEARVLADEDGSFCQEIISKLEEHSWQLKQELDRGLPLEEFSKVQKVRDAVEAGIKVLKRICAPQDLA